MRTILMATLALAPLVHAQGQSSSQPRGANAPVLESKLVSPKPVDGASPNVIQPASSFHEPKLIKWTNITEDQRQLEDNWRSNERKVTVSMTVTETGVPTHLKVIDSNDPLLNHSVMDAVTHYRFTPASLDSKPTAVPLVLTVRVLPATN
jgi:hypothetical protein